MPQTQELTDLVAAVEQTLEPLSAERIARGDTRELRVTQLENGLTALLFISTDGVTKQSSVVFAVKPAKPGQPQSK